MVVAVLEVGMLMLPVMMRCHLDAQDTHHMLEDTHHMLVDIHHRLQDFPLHIQGGMQCQTMHNAQLQKGRQCGLQTHGPTKRPDVPPLQRVERGRPLVVHASTSSRTAGWKAEEWSACCLDSFYKLNMLLQLER